MYNNLLIDLNESSFKQVSVYSVDFNNKYNGRNIIQDDIFSVIQNYGKQKKIQIKILKIPSKGKDFLAFTLLKKGNIFVVINSALAINQQIFAAAHELYHIRCYFKKEESSLLNGFMQYESDSEKNSEELEANAFAALLLVPDNALFEQFEIQKLDKEDIKIADIITLMDVFAVPYRTIVKRLYEVKYIDKSLMNDFLNIDEDLIHSQCRLSNLATRWIVDTGEIDLAGLDAIIKYNSNILSENRINEDVELLEKLKNELVL